MTFKHSPNLGSVEMILRKINHLTVYVRYQYVINSSIRLIIGYHYKSYQKYDIRNLFSRYNSVCLKISLHKYAIFLVILKYIPRFNLKILDFNQKPERKYKSELILLPYPLETTYILKRIILTLHNQQIPSKINWPFRSTA